jgi:hypothetical protein
VYQGPRAWFCWKGRSSRVVHCRITPSRARGGLQAAHWNISFLAQNPILPGDGTLPLREDPRTNAVGRVRAVFNDVEGGQNPFRRLTTRCSRSRRSAWCMPDVVSRTAGTRAPFQMPIPMPCRACWIISLQRHVRIVCGEPPGSSPSRPGEASEAKSDCPG